MGDQTVVHSKKPLPNPKSLRTFSHAQSVSKPDIEGRQLAVDGKGGKKSKRPEQGVRLIYGCVLYTQNYGTS